jgi:hypothetical protein
MATAEEELVDKLILNTLLEMDKKQSQILDVHRDDFLMIVSIKQILSVNNQIFMESIRTVMVTVMKQCNYESDVDFMLD